MSQDPSRLPLVAAGIRRGDELVDGGELFDTEPAGNSIGMSVTKLFGVVSPHYLSHRVLADSGRQPVSVGVVTGVASLEERLAVLSPHLYDAVPLTVTADEAGVSLRTAQRWLTSYRAEGASALVRSGRSDNGGWRIPAELVELIEG